MFEAVELVEQCRKAAGADVSLASDDELLAAAVALVGARAALDGAEAHVLGELERRGTCDRRFGLSTGSWVANETRSARPASRSRVRLGAGLWALGAVDDALSDGRITLDHARVLVEAAANPRVGDHIVALQAQLVDGALGAPFEIWRRDVATLVELLDHDGGFDPDRDLARNRAHLSAVGADRVIISAELVGEHALAFVHLVNQRADELFARYQRDHDTCDHIEIPPRSTLVALALVELVRHGAAADRDHTRAPVTDLTLVWHTNRRGRSPAPVDHRDGDRSPARRSPQDPTHDTVEPTNAMFDPANHAGQARERPHDPDARDDLAAPASRSGVVEVADGLGWWATVDGAVLTGLDRYRHLLCDPTITAVVLDPLGVPLDAGRTVRFATPTQRRALTIRDGGCVFPGCDAPASWCDAHHVDHHEHGGPTDLPNLALLCRHHHGVTHRTGWTMTTQPDHTYTWTTPTGQILQSQRHHRRPPPGR